MVNGYRQPDASGAGEDGQSGMDVNGLLTDGGIFAGGIIAEVLRRLHLKRRNPEPETASWRAALKAHEDLDAQRFHEVHARLDENRDDLKYIRSRIDAALDRPRRS